ncbi:hypothetical protein [Shewanella sp.]|uniref:hypothetical protein n=1 Tax=Shewanella sp. TaxID=50422 RepID=UPI004047A0D8
MSGIYPSTPEFQAVNLKSSHNNLSSVTISGRVQVRSIGGQKWQFSAKYNPMTRAEFQPVFAFVTSQQGSLGTFTIVPPVIGSTSGTASGVALVNGATSAGATSVPVDGFTGVIKAGDFIKFGHSKVYMVIADRNGAGNISIEPALVSAVSNNEPVTYNNVAFTMRLKNDVQSFGLSQFEYYTYEVDMEEVI